MRVTSPAKQTGEPVRYSRNRCIRVVAVCPANGTFVVLDLAFAQALVSLVLLRPFSWSLSCWWSYLTNVVAIMATQIVHAAAAA
jgi:hypothetical protein